MRQINVIEPADLDGVTVGMVGDKVEVLTGAIVPNVGEIKGFQDGQSVNHNIAVAKFARPHKLGDIIVTIDPPGYGPSGIEIWYKVKVLPFNKRADGLPLNVDEVALYFTNGGSPDNPPFVISSVTHVAWLQGTAQFLPGLGGDGFGILLPYDHEGVEFIVKQYCDNYDPQGFQLIDQNSNARQNVYDEEYGIFGVYGDSAQHGVDLSTRHVFTFKVHKDGVELEEQYQRYFSMEVLRG